MVDQRGLFRLVCAGRAGLALPPAVADLRGTQHRRDRHEPVGSGEVMDAQTAKAAINRAVTELTEALAEAKSHLATAKAENARLHAENAGLRAMLSQGVQFEAEFDVEDFDPAD